jgi:hypothetical protein
MTLILSWAWFSIKLVFGTWIYFLAIMRLREMRDAGKMDYSVSPVLFICGRIALVIGLVMDVLVNYIVATVVLMELPRLKEPLTTARLCRWYHSTDTSWYTRNVRLRFVRFGQIMLDSADTTGQHIK